MIIFCIILAIVVLILYFSYVGVIQAKNQLDEALSGIDVQLKMRCDLIPNLLKMAQKFMKHETETFTKITTLRTEVMKQPIGTAKRFAAESKLQDAIKPLLVSVENYPQLKSDTTMEKAMENFAQVEENIAASRRFYNTALRELKNKIQIFPSSLFAKYAGDISDYVYFKASKQDKKPIDVNDYL